MGNNIGILGLGLVGKSVLNFFNKQYPNILIRTWDQKIKNRHTLKDVCLFSDKLIVSPGFKIHKILNELCLQNKTDNLIGELDIFADNFKKPTIAITGSLGKTSIVNLLNSCLGDFKKAEAAGNIGLPMLDIIEYQNSLDIAILELSSFQLNLSHKFAPDIALITNFYPNHLDWHSSLDDYLLSKLNIFRYQSTNQISIFPVELLNNYLFSEKIKKIESKICILGRDFDIDLNKVKQLNLNRFCYLYKKENCFYVSRFKNNIKVRTDNLFDLNGLPRIGFIDNWYFILAILYFLKLDLKKALCNQKKLDNNFVPHRLEKFAEINGIDFYDDSKATVFQATQSAIKKLQQKNRDIILILGGLDKGVDRTSFFKSLKTEKQLKTIYFFGDQCFGFKFIKQKPSLEDVLSDIFQIAKSGDLVLFSPSGASFDLFNNYEHRGKVFKELVWSIYGGCSK